MIWHNRQWAVPQTTGEFLLVVIQEGKEEKEYAVAQLDANTLAQLNRRGKFIFEQFGKIKVFRWATLPYAREFANAPSWAYTNGLEYFGTDDIPKPSEQLLTVVKIDRPNNYPLYRHFLQTTVVDPNGRTVFDKEHQDHNVHTLAWAHLPAISEEPDMLLCDNCRHKGKGKICGVHGYLMYGDCQDYKPERVADYAKV